MTLTELRYIVAVARERHFGHAATACFVSQPTLSVAVRKLENELGVTLFERGASEVSVTPAGQRIVAQAQRVLEEAAAIPRLAAQSQDELAGAIRLGVIYTVGPYLLPQLIPHLRQSAPRMPLLLEENFTAVLSERLKQGQLDVIVLSLPYSAPHILTEALYEEPFVVLMPSGHPLANTPVIDAKTLAREDLLLLGPGHCFRNQVLEYCPECGHASSDPDHLRNSLEGGSLETIRLMVASGAGVTVLPLTSASTYSHADALVSLRSFAPPVPRRTIALAWRKSFPRPKAIHAIATAIRACEWGKGVTLLHSGEND